MKKCKVCGCDLSEDWLDGDYTVLVCDKKECFDKLNSMDELKHWIEGNTSRLIKKIDYMNEHVPGHRMIKYFEGQLVSNERILVKINELNK